MNKEHVAVQAALKAWPFPRGAGRIIDRLFGELTFRESTATVPTSDGFPITVRPNNLIGRHIYLTGEFDRSIVEILCNFSEPDDLLLDIGANIGYVSTSFLHLVPRSNVIAVDPQPAVLELLQSNLALFEGRSTIYPYALGTSDGEVLFEIDQQNPGASRVVTKESVRTTTIEMRSASRLFSDLNVSRLDLVKIDAEGHDEVIVRACINQLAKLQPKAIVFEGNSDGVKALLSNAGYDMFGIKKSLRKLTLCRASGSYHDCVAVSRSRKIPPRARDAYGI
jgi:FkbM family methyltransferase